MSLFVSRQHMLHGNAGLVKLLHGIPLHALLLLKGLHCQSLYGSVGAGLTCAEQQLLPT
jgi:hypothetical protein